jgi:hypothetical protein
MKMEFEYRPEKSNIFDYKEQNFALYSSLIILINGASKAGFVLK